MGRVLHGLVLLFFAFKTCVIIGGDIMLMNSKQIDELNELLKDHGETLTAFYDEGINFGKKKGFIVGAIGSLIGSTVIIVASKLKNRK